MRQSLPSQTLLHPDPRKRGPDLGLLEYAIIECAHYFMVSRLYFIVKDYSYYYASCAEYVSWQYSAGAPQHRANVPQWIPQSCC